MVNSVNAYSQQAQIANPFQKDSRPVDNTREQQQKEQVRETENDNDKDDSSTSLQTASSSGSQSAQGNTGRDRGGLVDITV